jgi:hypothetical protein
MLERKSEDVRYTIATFNQRFSFPPPFAMKIIKINLWN